MLRPVGLILPDGDQLHAASRDGSGLVGRQGRQARQRAAIIPGDEMQPAALQLLRHVAAVQRHVDAAGPSADRRCGDRPRRLRRAAAGRQQQQRQHEPQPSPHSLFPLSRASGNAAARCAGRSGTGRRNVQSSPAAARPDACTLPDGKRTVSGVRRRVNRCALPQARCSPRNARGPASSSASRSAGGESASQIGANERRWCGVTPSLRIASTCAAVAISGIGLPAISGMAPRQRAHDPVARHLGHDRRRRDRQAQ